MIRLRLIFLSAAMSFAPAMADEIGDSGNSGDESGDSGGSDTDDSAKDEGCMAAAVNPTTALSVGLGVALLVGLRRRD
jgi:hypothetical protein